MLDWSAAALLNCLYDSRVYFAMIAVHDCRFFFWGGGVLWYFHICIGSDRFLFKILNFNIFGGF